MNINYQTVLKHIALITKVIGLFPVLIILSYVFCQAYDISRATVDLAELILMGYLGYAQMAFRVKITQIIKKRRWLAWIFMVIGYVACLIIIMLIARTGRAGIKQQLLFGGISILFYVIFMMAYARNYSYILSMEFVVTITAVYYLALRLCEFEGLGMMYICVVAAYIFINNQLNMDAILDRTKSNTPMIKRIRKDNMKWVCLLMSIIFIGYPFRKILAAGLRYIVDGVLVCLLYIVKIIISLFSDKEMVYEASGQAGQGGFLLEGDKNSIVDIVIWLIVITSITLFIYKNREFILQSLKDSFRRIYKLFKHVWDFLFGRKKSNIITNDYYEDIIEECSSNIPLKAKKNEGLHKKKWQKKVKKYLKVEEQKNQYREGYKLLLEGVTLRGIEIRKANTPREIMLKLEEELVLQSIEETIIYEYVRYGEGITKPEEIVKIKSVLKYLLSID